MITGIHALIYSFKAEADRKFFRDVLRFPHVAAGDGWLIFALPPAEMGVHPASESEEHELHLMCDDIHATVKDLKKKGVKFTKSIEDMGFGLWTLFKLPGGSEMGLYEPRHPSPLEGGKAKPAGKAKAAKAKAPAKSKPKAPAKPAAKKAKKKR